jgi:phosphatidate phosphatase PAH1
MDMINESPVQAFEYQDHEAHIKVHMSAMQDPEVTEMAGQSPAAEVIMSSLDSHVREHLAFQYRRQIEQELGTELPPVGEELPEDIEKRLSTMVAEAAEQLLGKKQMQQEAEEAAALAEDPLIQQKERELDIKESDVQRKAQADQLKTQTQQQLAQQRTAIEVERIKSQERIAEAGHEAQERLSQAGHEAQEKLSQAELAQKVASDLMDAEMEDKKISGDQYARGIEIGVDIAKNLIEEDDDQSGRGDAGT